MTGLTYRGLRLDGPLAEFHRAVDRLRSDTVPGPLTRHQLPATSPPRHGRPQPTDGQGCLPDPKE